MSEKTLKQRFHEEQNSILVVGSINLDLNSFVHEFPVRNQTIAATESNIDIGGKGFNQAVAAARAGSNVSFVGSVGAEDFGQAAISALQKNGVDTTHVKQVATAHTGTANIMVNELGDNMIAVAPGANNHLSTTDIVAAEACFESADVMICQLECPLDVVDFALEMAISHGVEVVLNPAPVVEGVESLLNRVDYLTPNETEALEITGYDPSREYQRQATAAKLQSLGANCSIITLGSEGAYLTEQAGESQWLPAFKVNTVNTTGAGDTFNGAFACGVARKYSLLDAVIYASAASALSVTGRKTYESAPTHQQIIEFIAAEKNDKDKVQKDG